MPPVPARLATAVAAAVMAATSLGACATGRAPAAGQDPTAALEKLRAENAAYARKIEELENQVFILNDELEARRGGQPQTPAAPVPPPLPEVKLAPGHKTPEPEPTAPPESLVDETVVEYAGAAAEPRGKRPMLRLWGPSEGPPPPAASDEEPATATATAPRGRRRPGATVRPDAAVPSPSAAAGPGSDRAMAAYQRAMELVQGRRHDEAVAALRAFVKDFAAHDLADNAQYWLGECFYDRKDYSMALREFRRVSERFPDGNKVPDALLKTAFSYLALGSVRPGRETLQQITRNHARHPAASLAAAKLATLPGADAASLEHGNGGRPATAEIAPSPKEKVR